jgi:hypothetical protein
MHNCARGWSCLAYLLVIRDCTCGDTLHAWIWTPFMKFWYLVIAKTRGRVIKLLSLCERDGIIAMQLFAIF